MLSNEKEHSMSRKEYLKKKKKSKLKFPFLKPILISLVMVALFVYVIHQLHVYNTVTEIADKVVEESKLIKTYKMYFMSKPYEKDSDENILYLYSGSDESRIELEEGKGLSQIQVRGEYIYGLKEDNLVKINTFTLESEVICKENILAYNINENGIYVYRYYKNDKTKTGIYRVQDTEELIINKAINQFIMDEKYIFIVAENNTSRTLIRYNLDGKEEKVLTNKIIVNNIVENEEYVYYTNSSDKNKIYRIGKDGSNNMVITNNKCAVDLNKYNGNSMFCVYGLNVIYINDQDQKVYIAGDGKEEILIDNSIKYLQLNEKMLYVALKDKIDIYRFSLDKGDLEKITGARFTEFVFVSN